MRRANIWEHLRGPHDANDPDDDSASGDDPLDETSSGDDDLDRPSGDDELDGDDPGFDPGDEDAFDSRLRVRTPFVDPLADDDFSDILTDAEEELRLQTAGLHPQRAVRATPVFDSREWLNAGRMSQTEASLRLAMSLLTRKLVASDVVVALTGGELTRARKPRFPVAAFLESLGFTETGEHPDWRGLYTSPAAEYPLDLHNRLGVGDVVAQLKMGRRLYAEVTGGPLKPTRSPSEHKLLRRTIGAALTAEHAFPDDIVVAVVPRSERFRELARSWRPLPRMCKADISIVIVDRAGTVTGCPPIETNVTVS